MDVEDRGWFSPQRLEFNDSVKFRRRHVLQKDNQNNTKLFNVFNGVFDFIYNLKPLCTLFTSYKQLCIILDMDRIVNHVSFSINLEYFRNTVPNSYFFTEFLLL